MLRGSRKICKTSQKIYNLVIMDFYDYSNKTPGLYCFKCMPMVSMTSLLLPVICCVSCLLITQHTEQPCTLTLLLLLLLFALLRSRPGLFLHPPVTMSAMRVDAKVVMLGKESVGKTSLVERYVHHRFLVGPYQNVSVSCSASISMSTMKGTVIIIFIPGEVVVIRPEAVII